MPYLRKPRLYASTCARGPKEECVETERWMVAGRRESQVSTGCLGRMGVTWTWCQYNTMIALQTVEPEASGEGSRA